MKRYCDWEDPTACFLKNGTALPQLERVPILQGSAPSGRAIFSALLPTPFVGQWFLHDPSAKTLVKLAVSNTITRPQSAWRVEQIGITGLSTGKRYHLLLADTQGKLRDLRSFRTIPEADPASPLRIVFLSGTHTPDMWTSLAGRDPQLLVAMGNIVSAHQGTGALWDRYVEAIATMPFQRSPSLVPMIAIWNDHEFGAPEGDLTNPASDQARETFEAFFPSVADAKTLRHGPGVAKALRVGGHTFVLLDNRSFRTPNARPSACAHPTSPPCLGKRWSATPNNDESHFGRVQEDWVLLQIESAPGPVWLVSGDPWFGEHLPFESFAGNHPRNFRKFFAQLKATAEKNRNAPALLFFSGASARTEMQKVLPFAKYESFEITSAAPPASAQAHDWRAPPSPRLVAEAGEGASFLVASTEIQQGRINAEISAVGPAEKILFTKKILIEPVKPKPGRRSR